MLCDSYINEDSRGPHSDILVYFVKISKTPKQISAFLKENMTYEGFCAVSYQGWLLNLAALVQNIQTFFFKTFSETPNANVPYPFYSHKITQNKTKNAFKHFFVLTSVCTN